MSWCCEDITAQRWSPPAWREPFWILGSRWIWCMNQTRKRTIHWQEQAVHSPWTWLISELEERISSASFWAVGSTSVWWAVIRYWTSFCSWSLFIWNNVSEMGNLSLTCVKTQIQMLLLRQCRIKFVSDFQPPSRKEIAGVSCLLWLLPVLAYECGKERALQHERNRRCLCSRSHRWQRLSCSDRSWWPPCAWPLALRMWQAQLLCHWGETLQRQRND